MRRESFARRQRGVSLIEVLVAMLVVSLGVLAMAGLLATASRYGKTSEYRAVATLMASDMADRMRANKAALEGASTVYDVTGDYDTWSDEPADAPGCVTVADCLPAEIAAQDRAQWSQAVFANLPGGAGYVQVADVTNGSTVRNFVADVWVAWLDPEADGGLPVADNECPAALTVDPGAEQPRCAFFRIGL